MCLFLLYALSGEGWQVLSPSGDPGIQVPSTPHAAVSVCASKVAMVGNLFGPEVTYVTCAHNLLARTSHRALT